ncbi:MAG: hypothetical protein AABZ57_08670, partial [Candidatus Margulisiibacteriota bacterium]
NIDRIEIIAEPVSLMYGADAMGGVINIITKKGQDKPVSFSASAGSYGQVNAKLGAGAKI